MCSLPFDVDHKYVACGECLCVDMCHCIQIAVQPVVTVERGALSGGR